jgi:hypothetical protein
MPNIPEQPAAWPDIPLIAKTDRVLGGPDGPANAPLIAMLQRMELVREAAMAAQTAATAAQTLASSAGSAATAAASNAQTAITNAATAQTAASAAGAVGSAAQTAAQSAAATATAAQTAANSATTAATAAQSTATTASTTATTALTTAQARAVRLDLGSVTITYSAALAVGAGARSLTVACVGAQPGDAVFVAATAAIPDGYAVGAAQCLVADTIRVSVVHPALALGANFSIPLRVFVLR